MKQTRIQFPLILGLVCITIFSCKKEKITKSEIKAEEVTERSNSLQDQTKVFVSISNGNYISSYGGGITFGTNLPHPTSLDPNGYQDGQPIPTIDFVNWTLNSAPITYVINGAYFNLLEPTFPTSGLQVSASSLKALRDYDEACRKISSDTTKTYEQKRVALAELPNPTIFSTYGTSGDFKVVSGLLITDHLSTTKMSVVSEKYIPTSTVINVE